jgi:hypothetical protein
MMNSHNQDTDDLLKAGKFAEAGQRYAEVLHPHATFPQAQRLKVLCIECRLL